MDERAAEATTPLTVNTVLEIGWLLIAMLTPLWVYFGSSRPFDPQKVFLFRTLLWGLISLAAARYVLTSPTRWPDRQRPPWLIPVLIVAGVLVVATLTAVDPRLSWWGSYERGQGSLTQLSYLLLFGLVAVHLRSMAQAWRLLTALVLTAIPLTLLAFAQAAGWQPLPLWTDARSAVYATLGRANFLAAYLVILLPLTLALGIHLRHRWAQMVIAVLLLAELLVIGLTWARTAWLAAVVSLGLFALLWWGKSWPGRRWLGLALAVTAVSGPLLILLNISPTGSLAARLTIWRATVRLIGERPFLGYGPDSLGLVFPRVYPPELVYYQGRDFFVDRAHNNLLDWVVTMGVIGVLAHLLLWGSVFWLMGRALRQTSERSRRLLLIAILSALVGNLTNNLTSFEVTTTAVPVWLLLGMGVALSQPAAPCAPQVTPSGRRWIGAALVMVMGLAAIWWGNGRPFLADNAAHRAYHLAQTAEWSAAVHMAQRATQYAPYEPTYHHDLAWLYWQQAGQDPAALLQAETALLAARDARPLAYGRWLALAELYAAATAEWGMDASIAATTAYARAAQLAPHHSQVYTAWGQFVWVMEEWDTAVSHWQQAVDLDATNGPAHAYLAQSYWLAGEEDKAVDALNQALKFDPQNGLALALQQQMLATP
ncbi:MAG: O-antigen ligase family protein [Anaerolineae bacterium]|nr:O-antigen ligase family protein [Anaerolineae bacterium]